MEPAEGSDNPFSPRSPSDRQPKWRTLQCVTAPKMLPLPRGARAEPSPVDTSRFAVITFQVVSVPPGDRPHQVEAAARTLHSMTFAGKLPPKSANPAARSRKELHAQSQPQSPQQLKKSEQSSQSLSVAEQSRNSQHHEQPLQIAPHDLPQQREYSHRTDKQNAPHEPPQQHEYSHRTEGLRQPQHPQQPQHPPQSRPPPQAYHTRLIPNTLHSQRSEAFQDPQQSQLLQQSPHLYQAQHPQQSQRPQEPQHQQQNYNFEQSHHSQQPRHTEQLEYSRPAAHTQSTQRAAPLHRPPHSLQPLQPPQLPRSPRSQLSPQPRHPGLPLQPGQASDSGRTRLVHEGQQPLPHEGKHSPEQRFQQYQNQPSHSQPRLRPCSFVYDSVSNTPVTVRRHGLDGPRRHEDEPDGRRVCPHGQHHANQNDSPLSRTIGDPPNPTAHQYGYVLATPNGENHAHSRQHQFAPAPSPPPILPQLSKLRTPSRTPSSREKNTTATALLSKKQVRGKDTPMYAARARAVGRIVKYDEINSPGSPEGAHSSSGGSDQRDQHQCTFPGCSKTFERRYNLRVHMRRHTGETPYPCKQKGCSLMFKWRSSLAHHMKTRHKLSVAPSTVFKQNGSASPGAITDVHSKYRTTEESPQLNSSLGSQAHGLSSSHGPNPLLPPAHEPRMEHLHLPSSGVPKKIIRTDDHADAREQNRAEPA